MKKDNIVSSRDLKVLIGSTPYLKVGACASPFVKGRFVLVTLINCRYQYIGLSDRHPVVVKIPPSVLHGAINLDLEPCVLVNALLRHKPVQERDYLPWKRPFPYDLTAVKAMLAELKAKVGSGATSPTNKVNTVKINPAFAS